MRSMKGGRYDTPLQPHCYTAGYISVTFDTSLFMEQGTVYLTGFGNKYTVAIEGIEQAFSARMF